MTRELLLARAGTVALLTGCMLVINAMVTVIWQEPLSAIYAAMGQGELASDLADLEQGSLDVEDTRALLRLTGADERMTFLGASLRRQSRAGDAIGRVIARGGRIDAVFVRGAGEDELRRGPGWYPSTAVPGVRGTTAIAGHRTTYGAPFRHIDKLSPGETVVVEMPYGRYVYRVQQRKIVSPSAVEVLGDVDYDRLVLTACHPLYSAAKRIVIFARQIKAEPRGAARTMGALAEGKRSQARTLPDAGLRRLP